MRANNNIIPSCNLCWGQASLYCPSDSAFLCPSCDSSVHQANFLVARHLRQPLCPNCLSISGCLEPPASLCATCSLPFAEADVASSSSSSSSSACKSSAAVAQRRKTVSSGLDEVTSGRRSRGGRATCENPNPGAMRQDAKAEAVFVIWCKRMGLECYAGEINNGASRVLAACRGRLTALPLRVAVAASFWLGMRMWRNRMAGSSTWQRQGLKRLEEVSGVPAKLILAVDANLRRAVTEAQRKQAGRTDLREGWAECCPTN